MIMGIDIGFHLTRLAMFSSSACFTKKGHTESRSQLVMGVAMGQSMYILLASTFNFLHRDFLVVERTTKSFLLRQKKNTERLHLKVEDENIYGRCSSRIVLRNSVWPTQIMIFAYTRVIPFS